MSLMRQEITEISQIIAQQISEGLSLYQEAGKKFIAHQGMLMISARGTSHHAAYYFKFLLESQYGRLVACLSPSLSSVYQAKLQLENSAILSISQSGTSPDLIASQQNAKAGGATGFCLSNHVDSPLAVQADMTLPLLAGEEQAVAATKTFAASLFACYAMVSGMTQSGQSVTFNRLLDNLQQRNLLDKARALEILQASHSVLIISRGGGMAIAQEAALKLKETCLIHAESYSAAELMHGPMVLARNKIVLIAFMTNDAGNASIKQAIEVMAHNGAQIITIEAGDDKLAHLAPIVQIGCFYDLVETLSVQLGFNPDNPPMLSKATQTI